MTPHDTTPRTALPISGRSLQPAILWSEVLIGDERYIWMNLDHPAIEQRILAEMDAGIAVYYDRRWETTGVFSEWMVGHPEVIRGKRVLVLGAGVGVETLIIGRHCRHVWINDLAPVALELCAEQLEQNGIKNYSMLPGRFEELDLPEVDLVVASFLIYNNETLQPIRAFIQRNTAPLIVVNERLKPFRKFLKSEPHTVLFDQDAGVGVLLER